MPRKYLLLIMAGAIAVQPASAVFEATRAALARRFKIGPLAPIGI
jgi:hypothetical protein